MDTFTVGHYFESHYTSTSPISRIVPPPVAPPALMAPPVAPQAPMAPPVSPLAPMAPPVSPPECEPPLPTIAEMKSWMSTPS